MARILTSCITNILRVEGYEWFIKEPVISWARESWPNSYEWLRARVGDAGCLNIEYPTKWNLKIQNKIGVDMNVNYFYFAGDIIPYAKAELLLSIIEQIGPPDNVPLSATVTE